MPFRERIYALVASTEGEQAGDRDQKVAADSGLGRNLWLIAGMLVVIACGSIGLVQATLTLGDALRLPLNYADRNLLPTLTFGVVLFTLLVQGLTIQPLLARPGVTGPDAAPATSAS